MSLYRKYRPQTFEDVVGQDHIAHTLRNALSASPLRIAHAYLFCGPRGTGKTTSARLLAKCLNCEKGPTPTPCNECDFCVRVRDNQPVMDLIEIDAATNRKIENAREIISVVSNAPAQGRYRVYILDEVHMLTPEAFNALLKTFEEPPPHAVFILATTDSHKVPATITSRCQRFDFRRVGPSDIVSRLHYVAKCEGLDLTDEAARLIATTADGAMRNALTLLEQVAAFSPSHITAGDVRVVLGTVSQELLVGLMDAVAQQNPVGVLEQIDLAVDEGASFSQLTNDLTNYCRDLLLLTVGYESSSLLTDEEKKQRHRHAQLIGRGHLMNCVEALRLAAKDMRDSTDHRLLLELTLVRACDPSLANANATPSAAPAKAPARTPATPTRPQPAWRQPEAPAEHTSEPAPARETTPAPPIETATPTVESNGAAISGSNDAVPVEIPAEVEAPPVAPDEAPVHNHETDSVTAEAEPAALEATEPGAPPVAEEPVVVVKPAPKKGRRIHNIEEFIELWPKVLVRVKNKIGVTAVAYLHNALPVALTDEEAVLEFTKEFHYEKACEAAKRLPFEQILNECMATPHRLSFRWSKPVQQPEPEPEPEPEVQDYEEDDDVLKLAQDMFAAEVVGRSGQG